MSVDMTRQQLEELALQTCSAENYFDIANVIDTMTREQLEGVISCGGDYEKEWARFEAEARS